MAEQTAMAWLFAYGTLRKREVQQATFGRILDALPDTLCGYRLAMLAIADPMVVATSGSDRHPIIYGTGNLDDEVVGAALLVTPAELIRADDYEVTDYRRVPVVLKSGRVAFAYVAATRG